MSEFKRMAMLTMLTVLILCYMSFQGGEEQLLLCHKNDYKKIASDHWVCFFFLFTFTLSRRIFWVSVCLQEVSL